MSTDGDDGSAPPPISSPANAASRSSSVVVRGPAGGTVCTGGTVIFFGAGGAGRVRAIGVPATGGGVVGSFGGIRTTGRDPRAVGWATSSIGGGCSTTTMGRLSAGSAIPSGMPSASSRIARGVSPRVDARDRGGGSAATGISSIAGISPDPPARRRAHNRS
jgi:hypothetical protein